MTGIAETSWSGIKNQRPSGISSTTKNLASLQINSSLLDETTADNHPLNLPAQISTIRHIALCQPIELKAHYRTLLNSNYRARDYLPHKMTVSSERQRYWC